MTSCESVLALWLCRCEHSPSPTPPPAAHFLPSSLLTGICNLS